jgi:hypothetical protein
MGTSGGSGDGSRIVFSGACGESKRGESFEFAANNVTENPSVLDRRSNVERPDDDDQS